MAMAQAIPLFTARATTGTGTTREAPGPGATVQATVSGTGAVSATVLIQVSNDGTSWLTLGTLTLSGTTTATNGLALNAHWVYIRGNITAISGTSAAVSAIMGTRDRD